MNILGFTHLALSKAVRRDNAGLEARKYSTALSPPTAKEERVDFSFPNLGIRDDLNVNGGGAPESIFGILELNPSQILRYIDLNGL